MMKFKRLSIILLLHHIFHFGGSAREFVLD